MTALRRFWAAGPALLIAAAATALAAESPVLRILTTDCARLVRHVPASGVAHEPGVDVRGRPVVPADLDAGPDIVTPDHFLIPIEVDLADRLGIPASPDNAEADAFIGLVELRGDRAFFNGRPLQSKDEATLAAVCRATALQP